MMCLHPKHFFPISRSETEDYSEHASFPLMFKTICSHSRLGGGRNYVARNREQLLKLYDENEDLSNINFFLQEYIPGNLESSWMFNGYFNEQSECIFGMTGKKILQFPAEAGVTSIGLSQKNDEILETSKRFLTNLGYKGMVDIDYRYDKRDNKYKILDVNPRIGLTFRLFVGNNGIDVMQTAYMDLTGKSIPPFQIINGRRFFGRRFIFFLIFSNKFFQATVQTAKHSSLLQVLKKRHILPQMTSTHLWRCACELLTPYLNDFTTHNKKRF